MKTLVGLKLLRKLCTLPRSKSLKKTKRLACVCVFPAGSNGVKHCFADPKPISS